MENGKTPYELLGGEEGVKRLAYQFYDSMVELHEAKGIRAMHGDDLSDIQEKLFMYLSGWLGGPPLYQQKYNTVCLTSPHKPFAIGAAERDAWLATAMAALKRGGTFAYIGHDLSNLEHGTGGPQTPAVLATPDDIVRAAPRLEPLRAEVFERAVQAEPEHGTGSTSDAIALDTLVVGRKQ